MSEQVGYGRVVRWVVNNSSHPRCNPAKMASSWVGFFAVVVGGLLLLGHCAAPVASSRHGDFGDLKHRGARNQASLIFEAMDMLSRNSSASTNTSSATTVAAPPTTTMPPNSSSATGNDDDSAVNFHELIYGLVRSMQLNASRIQNSVLTAVNDRLPKLFNDHDTAVQETLVPKLNDMIRSTLHDELERHDRQVCGGWEISSVCDA